eukprot:scaffold237558_cov21-Tisochrysis_lutea.AAC.1
MLVKQEDAVRGGGAVMLRAGRCLVLGALVQGLGPVGEAGCCKDCEAPWLVCAGSSAGEGEAGDTWTGSAMLWLPKLGP